MAESGNNGAAKESVQPGQQAGQGRPAPQVKMQIIAQYMRDLSFENVLAQKGGKLEGVQPQINVKVGLDARKRDDENQYEIVMKLNVTSENKADKTPVFLLELEYGGLFRIEGVPNEQLHPYLLIECPRMLFPYVRRIVSDVTRDGGFIPLNLDNVDFMALYRQEVMRQAEAKKAAGGDAAAQPKPA